MTTNDPIVAGVRAARDKHAAQFGYDLKEIFRDIKAKQQASGRKFVRYPSRPAVATTTPTTSNE
ncbi:MAG: hypothetical protein ABIP48_14355 [Planctomycetota bacterium]